MNLQEYSQSVGSRVGGLSGGETVGSIAAIVAFVLPLLTQLPCLKPKSPEQKREWVEDHPHLATRTVAQELRKQSGTGGHRNKVDRKQFMSTAETIVNDYLATPDDKIIEMGIEI